MAHRGVRALPCMWQRPSSAGARAWVLADCATATGRALRAAPWSRWRPSGGRAGSARMPSGCGAARPL
eukprot:5375680-Lingulodinium_polyedra.AAC.1